MFIKVLAIVLLVTSVAAEDAAKNNNFRSEFKKSLSRDCAKSYSVTCLKLDIVSWVDKLNEDDNYSVIPGVTVVREENGSARANTADIVAELAREFPDDPEARLDAFLMKKVTGYVNSHSVKLNNFWGGGEVAEARKKGGGGGGGGLLAIGGLFASTLGALALGGIAAIAGKALMAALMSLVLAAAAGLKGHGGGGSHSVEVVAKPSYIHEGGHGGHYRRSLDVPVPLVLRK